MTTNLSNFMVTKIYYYYIVQPVAVSLKADFIKLNVSVKQLGVNSSGINGMLQ